MPKDLKKLRQQRADEAKRGKAALEEFNALSAKDSRTEAEEQRVTQLDAAIDDAEAKVTALDAEIEAEEKAARRGALFSTSRAAGGLVSPYGAAARSFGADPARTSGFRSLGEFARAVQSSCMNQGFDARLNYSDPGDPEKGAAPTNFHQNQGAAGEGFLVPIDFRQNVWELVFQQNDLLSMITPEPTSSNSISIPKDETTPWGASGVQAYWRAEAGQMTASKLAAAQATVQLHELYAFVNATSEVLDDAPRLQNRLTNRAAMAINWAASDAIMWGDGNGKPLGFMNSAAAVTVSKETGQAAATLNAANLLKMESRLYRAGGGRPMYLANSDILPQLGLITIGNNAAWLPMNQGLQASPWEGFLNGKPLMWSEHPQTLGTSGDINLINLDGYLLATKMGGGLDFAASIHLFFDYNIQSFRWTFRVGGQPYLAKPVSPARGTTTKSHFVNLQNR
jgi:HK97 family phage major capsid protein